MHTRGGVLAKWIATQVTDKSMARIVTCPNCGRKNIDKLNVCRGCGLSLGGTVNSKKEQESTQATENDKHEVKDAEFSNLMECPDCKREISRNAPHCPGCGTPISAIPTEKPKTSNTKKKTSPLTWTLACLVGLALILSFTQKDREGSKPRSAISPSRVAHSPITKPSTPKLNHTYRYLGKTNSEIVAIFGGKPNKVGNVIFDDGTTKVLFESSNGTHISYIDVQGWTRRLHTRRTHH